MTPYESRMIIEERNPTYDEYKTLREAVGWWPTEDKSTKTALKNALYSVVALKKRFSYVYRCSNQRSKKT